MRDCEHCLLSEPGFSGLVDFQDCVSEVSRCYSCGWRGTETPPYRKNRGWKPLGQCGWRGTETPPYRKNRVGNPSDNADGEAQRPRPTEEIGLGNPPTFCQVGERHLRGHSSFQLHVVQLLIRWWQTVQDSVVNKRCCLCRDDHL